MLKQLINIPREEHFYIACSGGVDSMAIADFYKRGNKSFTLAYFHHATEQADKMEAFVRDWATKNNIPLVVGRLTNEKPKGASPEDFWRQERYAFFKTLAGRIVTCHHMNDVAETWIFSALHGKPKIIAVENGQVIRPFLLNSKQDLIDWAVRHDVRWVEDASNKDTNYPRNRIRNNIMSEALMINPGLFKVLRKKYSGSSL